MRTAPPPASELLGVPHTSSPGEDPGQPCNHEKAACPHTATSWRAKALGQRSAEEVTPRKKDMPSPPSQPCSRALHTHPNRRQSRPSCALHSHPNHRQSLPSRPPSAVRPLSPCPSSAEQCARDCDSDTALATTFHCSAKYLAAAHAPSQCAVQRPPSSTGHVAILSRGTSRLRTGTCMCTYVLEYVHVYVHVFHGTRVLYSEYHGNRGGGFYSQ